jgi:hypothetical protein
MRNRGLSLANNKASAFALVQVTPPGAVTGSAYVNTGDGAWLPLTGSVRGTTVKLVVQCSGGVGPPP